MALVAAACAVVIVVVCILWARRPDQTTDNEATAAEVATGAADIQRGEYLARIGNCISCHTRRGGEAFAGGVPFVTPYASFGTLYSTNITPDRKTGIGSWTQAQFLRSLREGRSPHRGRLFPAFPYPSFTRITDSDAKTIFAYLRKLKPISYAPPSNSGLFRMRWGMALWNTLFFKAGRFVPDERQSAQWNRGSYLVNGLGHCGTCHTPRNLLLAEKNGDAALAGGAYREPADGGTRKWYAVNLTSAASGLGSWSMEDIAKYLRTGHSPRAGIFGPMNDVVINSLQHLTEDDARAMALYLKSLPPLNESPKSTFDAATLEAGAAVYSEHCEKCHRASGRGAFLKAPPLAGSAVVQATDPATLINVILHGAYVGEGAPLPFSAWESMKGLGDKLTDEQVAAVSNYVRGSWGNRGDVVSTLEIAKQR